MGASGALIIYATYVCYLFSVSCIKQTGHLTKKFCFLRCVLLIGTIAGLSVILLATVSLETGNRAYHFLYVYIHIFGDWVLFDSFVLGNGEA